MSVKFSEAAIEDIYDLAGYIEEDNYEAAWRLAADIFVACDELGERPFLGHRRPEISRRSVRVWAVRSGKPYLVIYDAESKPVRILRVVHGARDLRRLPL